jgi:hypothetical protein
MARAAPRLSPEIITVRMPRARSAASASRAPGLGSSPKAISACSGQPLVGLCARPGPTPWRPRPAGARAVGQRAQRHAQLLHPAQAAHQVAAALHLALGAPARHGAHPCRAPAHFQAALARGRHHGARQRVLAAALQAGGAAAARLPRPAPGPPPARSAGAGPRSACRSCQRPPVSTLCASSSACASLIRMPCFAATPVPAMMAAGVASPSAQGQAITSTATARISAVSGRRRPQPAQQRQQRHHQHHRHEHRRHLVHQALDRRLGRPARLPPAG